MPLLSTLVRYCFNSISRIETKRIINPENLSLEILRNEINDIGTGKLKLKSTLLCDKKNNFSVISKREITLFLKKLNDISFDSYP